MLDPFDTVYSTALHTLIVQMTCFTATKGKDNKSPHIQMHLGGCQNDGPFLGTLNIRGRIIIGTPRGTIILTTTHFAGSRYRST